MNNQNATFEQSLSRLEQIVRELEKGDTHLDESIKLFQEGTGLVRSCEKLLDEAEFQVKKVLAGEDGAPSEEVFADDADI